MLDIAPVTHGLTDRAAEIGPFRLTETSHVPDTRLARHRHAYPAVTFVLQGGFSEDYGSGRTLDCSAMAVLVKPADAVHSNRYSRHGARSFILECTGESALDDCAPQLGLARLVLPVLELYDAFRSEAPERGLIAEEIVLEISRECTRASRSSARHRPRWLDDVAEMGRAACTTTVSLTTLAVQFEVHPVYLARVFRRHYGQSLGAFLLQCRVRLAMRRLATTQEPIASIAVDCGFADQAHFTRLFRREAGITPARFRRRSRLG